MKRIILAVSILAAIVGLLAGCATTTSTPLPLMSAAESGDINTVKALLDKGADANAKDDGGWTALTYAAQKGHTEAVKLLIEKGSDVNARGKNGHTALMMAAQLGHTAAIKLLIEKGADVNARNSKGWTALTYAAINGYTKAIKLLMEKGADIDAAIAGIENQMASYPEYASSYKSKIALLERLRQNQEIASQPVTTVSKSSQEVSPTIKSDVDELPTIKSKPNKNSYAIVIGIENYRQKLPKADYAVSDAKLVTEYLTKAMGYPEENVITLVNDHAAKSDFEKYFEKWLWNNVEKDSSVFIYYSGHGAPNPKTGDAYLVPYDGDPSFIEQTGYPLKKLYESLNKLQAKDIIVALDSCFSGAGGRSVIAKGSRPLVMNMESFTIPQKISVLSAASGDQISSTYEEKGHGLFTYFMLKGIKNEDVVKQDGSLDINGLHSYLKPQVERIARKQYNNEQTPQLIGGRKK